ncbi:unnamed protein product [Ilex paraguariensis]|uniref:E3 ubiquitin-protein ligase RMA n=1 Tax=Ilex paraguariensis TaxID=185542 RepID=A0ABC8QZR5_9AQUA
MALEQNFQQSMVPIESIGDICVEQKWKLDSGPTTALENVNGCFDCNICLDSAHDPVVTVCGHLYCWPCIYKWLHVRSSSIEPKEWPKCPICKANISTSSLIPLYGHGASPSECEAKRSQLNPIIPNRPPAFGASTLLTTATSMPSYPYQAQHPQYFAHPFGNYASMSSSSFGSTAITAMTSFFSPTVGMFGEMAFARMFGSSDTRLFTYAHPNSSPPRSGSGSPRIRRQEMQVDKSLDRVSMFLFCCFVLCLLLF